MRGGVAAFQPRCSISSVSTSRASSAATTTAPPLTQALLLARVARPDALGRRPLCRTLVSLARQPRPGVADRRPARQAGRRHSQGGRAYLRRSKLVDLSSCNSGNAGFAFEAAQQGIPAILGFPSGRGATITRTSTRACLHWETVQGSCDRHRVMEDGDVQCTVSCVTPLQVGVVDAGHAESRAARRSSSRPAAPSG